MIIGFTGTQEGLTNTQAEKLGYFLSVFEMHGIYVATHGDCIGADASFHEWCDSKGTSIVVWPPEKDSKRAFCDGVTSNIMEPLPYLVRNKKIVDMSNLLIACPKLPHEEIRSGTWMTVRYAREKRTPTLIIYPD